MSASNTIIKSIFIFCFRKIHTYTFIRISATLPAHHQIIICIHFIFATLLEHFLNQDSYTKDISVFGMSYSFFFHSPFVQFTPFCCSSGVSNSWNIIIYNLQKMNVYTEIGLDFWHASVHKTKKKKNAVRCLMLCILEGSIKFDPKIIT